MPGRKSAKSATSSPAEFTPLRESRKDFPVIFHTLKKLFWPYEKYMHVTSDTARRYYVQTKAPTFQGKPLFFGGVMSGRAHVSFHLMPVYWEPSLAKSMSPALKKHRDGMSRFNFTTMEPILFRELAALTRKGFALYKKKNLL